MYVYCMEVVGVVVCDGRCTLAIGSRREKEAVSSFSRRIQAGLKVGASEYPHCLNQACSWRNGRSHQVFTMKWTSHLFESVARSRGLALRSFQRSTTLLSSTRHGDALMQVNRPSTADIESALSGDNIGVCFFGSHCSCIKLR